MDEQLDNNLKKHIRVVFDNFEDPTADEGWLLLREKFPEKSKRKPLLWLWWSAAAILLLFLSIGIWLNSNQENTQQLVSNHPVQKHEESPNLKSKTDTVDDKIASAKKTIPGAGTNKTGITKVETPVLSTVKPAINKGINPGNLSGNHTDGKGASKNNLAANITDTNKTSSVSPAAKQIATIVQPNLPVSQSATVKPEQAADKKINSVFARDKEEPGKKENSKPKRVSFGVYAATYFNYAKGSNNAINAGAGFSAEIPLSKNLRLVTGVAIAQNSLNFTGDNILAISQTNSSVQAAFATLSTVAVVKDYNASLVGLDIPMNLKYEFNPQRNNLYILAGFSSGTFINETYTYHYNTGSAPALQTSSKGFSNFYFAKTLNVAFGMGFPFGKNRLIVEPFLKYPLDGLGSQNISFGSGGLNLKFNFQSLKK